MAADLPCGVCESCPHNQPGGAQFCIKCLRAHADHLEAWATRRCIQLVVSDDERLWVEALASRAGKTVSDYLRAHIARAHAEMAREDRCTRRLREPR